MKNTKKKPANKAKRKAKRKPKDLTTKQMKALAALKAELGGNG